MKITQELKIGVITIIGITLLIWGINYLKGSNLLHNSRVFYVKYENVDGLTSGRPVIINGLQVGRVSEIMFSPNMTGNLIVKLELENNFQFSNNSLAKIYGADLIGTKSILIDVREGTSMALSGDTLIGKVEPTITTLLNNEMQPVKVKLESLMKSIDIASNNFINLTGGKNKLNIEKTIYNLNKNLENLTIVTGSLKENNSKIDSIFSNASIISQKMMAFTKSLDKVEAGEVINNINKTVKEFDEILSLANKGNGSISKMLHDKELYDNLTSSAKELQELLQDIKINPKRYVHISVFGGGDNGEYKSVNIDTLKK